MSETVQPSLAPRLQAFLDEFGDELDTCNPNAYDLLVKIIHSGDMQAFEDFAWDYGDELDACHPDAFDFLYDVAQDYGVEMY